MPKTCCPVCENEHDYTPRTIRGRKCPTCFRKREAGRQQAWKLSKRQPSLCEDCAAELPEVRGKGKRRSRCAACHRRHLRQLDTARYYERRRTFQETGTCEDCGSTFPRTGAGGPVPTRCPSHTQMRSRETDHLNAQIRRARKLALPTDRIRSSEVHTRDGWVCGICHAAIDASLTWPDPASPSIDHIRPLSRGGHHVLANVQSAHLICNLRKAVSMEASRA